jgi:hypothetical protein
MGNRVGAGGGDVTATAPLLSTTGFRTIFEDDVNGFVLHQRHLLHFMHITRHTTWLKRLMHICKSMCIVYTVYSTVLVGLISALEFLIGVKFRFIQNHSKLPNFVDLG